MNCAKCGQANADKALFCSHCGLALRAADPQARPALATFTGSPDITGFDHEAWAAVIGPRNTDYYLPKFERQHRTGEQARWHWPAFFLTFYWLLYRKLWGWAACYFIAPYVVSLIIGIVVATTLQNHPVATAALWGCYLAVIFFGPPLVANGLYYQRCANVLRRYESADSRERYLAKAEAHGGTSRVVLFVVGLFVVVFLVGILAAIALPAYQDYTKRAKTAEAVVRGMTLARGVGAFYETHREIPGGADLAPLLPGPDRFAAAIDMNPTNGVITVAVRFTPGETSGHVVLIPAIDSSGGVEWSCKAVEPDFRRYIPKWCREK